MQEEHVKEKLACCFKVQTERREKKINCKELITRQQKRVPSKDEKFLGKFKERDRENLTPHP